MVVLNRREASPGSRPGPRAQARRRVTGGIVDCDVHPVLDPNRIATFLPQPWKQRWESGNRGAGVLGYWNPHDVVRRDAVLPDGRRIDSDPHALAYSRGRLGVLVDRVGLR